MNRTAFFSDLALSPARLDELAKQPDHVVRYFAPTGCGRAEARELAWRNRAAARARASALLADVISGIQSIATGPGTWSLVVAFTDGPTVAKRMKAAQVTFADVIEAAGFTSAEGLL